MVIDGKKLQNEIALELSREFSMLPKKLSVGVIKAGENKVIDNFVAIKKRFAEKIGVEVFVYSFHEDITQDELEKETKTICDNHDGVIVQLPLPKNLDSNKIINIVPENKDIDGLGRGKKEVLSPVIGAINEIIERHHIDLSGKIAILGSGRLVGRPAFYWLEQKGYNPIIFDENNPIKNDSLKNFDVIISGVGQPSLIKKDMIKDGVVIIDAGTSDEGGTISGDADPSCREKASYFTPVPGGIGPITVACLFKNLLSLYKKYGA